MNSVADKSIPEIPGYEIERQLGRGGMATVFLAKQVSLDRPVAIKLIATEAGQDEAMAQRFESEARVIAKLEHPGIVGIHEVGRTANGRLFYVMPFLPNGDLAQRDLGQNELGIVRVIQALLEALGYAHARGVVHRDVKPENVLFDALDRPRLADFGIALSSRAGSPRITSDGMTLGSSGYMAPEQARGEHIDGRADLYGVGVLAYELLCGEMPFRASDPLALAIRHAQDPVPRLPPTRRHWQDFIDRALAKRPDQRYRNAAAMLRALDQVERHILRRRGGMLRAWLAVPPLRSSPVLQLGIGLMLSFALGLGAITLLRSADNDSETLNAETQSERSRIDRLLGDAAVQFNAAALVEPAGGNAAESYLQVLALRPTHLEATQGMSVVFDALGQQMEDALQAGDEETARMRIEQARLLAESLPKEVPRSGMDGILERAQSLLDAEIQVAHERNDRSVAESRLALLTSLGLDSSVSSALVSDLLAWPKAGARLRDKGGPGLVFFPAQSATETTGSRDSPAFALMQQPLTLAEYRRFSQATKRSASRCRARLSPLRILDRRSWSDPGFEQRDSDPVVCISHADAQDYAAWLSRQTGQSYRLPSTSERRRAARSEAASILQGRRTLHEWMVNCAETSAQGSCSHRVAFAGNSGERSAESERGYDDIGVRLLREVTLENLPANK